MMFSFEQQLQALLSCTPLYDAMEAFPAKRFSTDGKVRSVFDSFEWQHDDFFTMHTDAYTVQYYYDDGTVTNPIGHYKRKVRCVRPSTLTLTC